MESPNDGTLILMEDKFSAFLRKTCRDQFLEILEKPVVPVCSSVNVNYLNLFEGIPDVGEFLLSNPSKALEILDRVAKQVLMDFHQERTNRLTQNNDNIQWDSIISGFTLCVRVLSLPVCPELTRREFPGCKDLNSFICIVGTVVRVKSTKLLEYSKSFQCNKCQGIVEVLAIPTRYHKFPKSDTCSNSCPNSTLIPVIQINAGTGAAASNSKFKEYQEIKLQEQLSKMDFGTMPKALSVVAENDLVDACKPGDDVSITGHLYLRWKPFRCGVQSESELVFKANHIQVNNDQRVCMMISDDMIKHVEAFWNCHKLNPFEGRNVIISSFCPQVYGMYIVKMAMCMILAGGVTKMVAGTKVRGESHILLVGDPGTGKSQLLKYASKIIPRSVITTGIGLTVSAVQENGEWVLEAGALVLADGGVCCIDEFNSMKEQDRISIHEAMEQQSISVAKAGMVAKLPTRVTLIAATNPKGSYDPNEPLTVNIGIDSPLLSRFDVVMVLMDKQDDEWDILITNFILQGKNLLTMPHRTETNKCNSIQNTVGIWDLDRLQSYLILVKELEPKMTNEAHEAISAYYKYQRNLEERNAARTTVRLLESLGRLSEGHARLMYRKQVLLHDAITAISLLEVSMQTSSMSAEVPNNLHTVFPTDPLEEYRNQAQLILEKLELHHLWEKECKYLDDMKKNYEERNT